MQSSILHLPTTLLFSMALAVVFPSYGGTATPLRVNPALVLASACQQVHRRLRSLLEPRSSLRSLGAFALPTEVILIITSQLDTLSSTALALTCRTLYSICFGKNELLSKCQEKQLLLWLEQESPPCYFCHRCLKLHRWHKRWSRYILPCGDFNTPCAPSPYPLIASIYLTAPRCLQYSYARLIMKRHLYGPEHGPALRTLERRRYRVCRWDELVQICKQDARIIDNQLLIRATMTLSHPRGDVTALRKCIDTAGGDRRGLCSHIWLRRALYQGNPAQLPELVKNDNDHQSSEEFSLCSQAMGSCVFCLTDYSVSVEWQGKRKGYLIVITTHRQIGDCQSPHDWAWQTMTDTFTEGYSRRAHPAGYRQGYVRDRWNKVDGVVEETRGKWVFASSLVDLRARRGWVG